MEGRFRRLLLAALLLGTGSAIMPAVAQQAGEDELEPLVEPRLERRQIRESDISSSDIEIGVFSGLISVQDFGTHSVTGGRLAYHITEWAFLEAAYGQTTVGETSFERLSGAVRLLTDEQRELTYYNLSLGLNIFPGETFLFGRAFNSQFYIIGGAGSTDFAGDDHFTLNFGAGYRLLLTDWFALHADVRDHIFDLDVTGEEETTHNLELHGGLTVYF